MSTHPFKKLTADYHAKAAAREQVQYEASRVKYLLKCMRMPTMGRYLSQKLERETGDYRLTFKGFNDEFHSFPVLLGAKKLDGVHLDPRTLLPAMMKDFAATPFVEAYETFYEDMQPARRLCKRATGPDDRVIGLVFPRKGIPSGLMIYATDELEVLPFAEKELLMPYLSGKGKNRKYLIVRSFGKVLEALYNGGHGWRPS